MRIITIIFTIIISINLFSQNLSDFLLPRPQQIIINNGQLRVNQGYLIPENPKHLKQTLLLGYHMIQSGIDAQLVSVPLVMQQQLIYFVKATHLNEQAYHLTIDSSKITIKACSDIGFHYALVTLNQIGNYANKYGYWPCVDIIDEPDFIRRGIMLDISRDKVPTTKTLLALIDQLSSWKINEIQLYTEHTFAYTDHQEVWQDASPLTAEEIQLLDNYCKDHFIDLVPNQNSFGHMHRWLKHPGYTHLAELEQPGKTIWGMRSKNTLSPVEEGSLELMQELYAELLPNFSSSYFNIGCDETVELGVGKSKQLCNEIGKGQVYLNYLLDLKKEVDQYGKTTMFWGDIILNHPDLIEELPKDMVALIWGYEASYPFDKNCRQFQKAGLCYYVCPGTSSWKSLIGRNQNAFANLRNAAINGKAHGARGYLVTDWGDYGHWQPLSVSYPAFIYGAALSWSFDKNKSIDIARSTSHFALNDETGISGEVIVNIGNAYLLTDAITDNSNIFHQLLQRNKYSIKTDRWLKLTNLQKLKVAQRYISDQINRLENADITSYDAETVNLELKQAAHLAGHACRLGIAKHQTKDGYFKSIPKNMQEELRNELQYLIDEHTKIWILRNREGGLEDSSEKMKTILNSY